MAKITWSVTTLAGTVTRDSPEISEANMDRFIDWLWVKFPQLDEQGNQLARTTAREAQAFRDWAQQQWQITKGNVLAHEEQVKMQAAKETIGDLT